MKYVLFYVIPFLFFSYTPILRFEKDNSTKGENSFYSKLKAGRVEPKILKSSTCFASYYAEEFHGKETANGEIFNMHNLTAAHISYPLNTICRVTNLKNDKSVVVRINDRKPDTNHRAIDLSLKAAQVIEMINEGEVKVRVDILEWGRE